MAADIPTTVPSQLRAGDTWKWTKSIADYPATAGWTLKYRFKSATGGFEITASASGADHSVTVAAATSAAYAAGTYSFVGWVEGGSSEKYTVDEGVADVLPDLRSGTATAAQDVRSTAQKMVDAIDAWLTGRDPGVAEYEIAGRRMKYWSPSELLKMRQRFQSELNAEQAVNKLAAGLGSGRKIQFRL